MSEEIRLSVSALNDYLKCGERFRRRRIENDWRPFGLAAHIGTAAHEVARLMHRRQIEAKATMNLPNLSFHDMDEGSSQGVRDVLEATVMSDEESRDQAATLFDVVIDEKGWEPNEDEKANPDAARGRAKDAAVDHAVFYSRKVSRKINPLSIERMVEVRPKVEASDVQVVLKGIIDMIDGSALGEEVVDRKTSAKTPREGEEHGDLQMSFYAALRLAETKSLPPQLRKEYTVRTPAKGLMSAITRTTSRTKQDVKEMLGRVEQTAKGIRAGVFMPADPSQWWCQRKFCEFYLDCKYTVGRRSHDE